MQLNLCMYVERSGDVLRCMAVGYKGSMSSILKGRIPLGNSGLMSFGAQGRLQLERERERTRERGRERSCASARERESRLVAEQREQRALHRIATNMLGVILSQMEY